MQHNAQGDGHLRNVDMEQQQEKANECEELSNQLKTAIERGNALQKELDFQKNAYDDLYAYSASRDMELDSINNSSSYKFYLRFLKEPMHIIYRILFKLFRMLKYLFTLDFKEFARELYMPVRRLSIRFLGQKQYRKIINELRKDIEGKRVIVMPPTFDWHLRSNLFQRPQQLAVAYAKKENTTVFYMTNNYEGDRVRLAERISDGLWLVNKDCVNQLKELLDGAKEVIVSLCGASNASYVRQIQPSKLIYEYIDALEISNEPDIIEHEWLMSRASVTVCTATELYNKAQGKAANPILSPNAGDYEFFAKTSEYEVNPLLRNKIKGYRCVLGYYGVLASWFDFELVKEIARRHSDWVFVLVGLNFEGTLEKNGIDAFENIVHIPSQPIQELPSFLTAFDVAIIPFLINEITISTSPVKLFEYMAGGKPVLASGMPECMKYESVHTYGDVDEFCRVVEEYLAMKPDDPYWKILKREAMENTWDARTDEILAALDKN